MKENCPADQFPVHLHVPFVHTCVCAGTSKYNCVVKVVVCAEVNPIITVLLLVRLLSETPPVEMS